MLLDLGLVVVVVRSGGGVGDQQKYEVHQYVYWGSLDLEYWLLSLLTYRWYGSGSTLGSTVLRTQLTLSS